jgi:hypothetical protein
MKKQIALTTKDGLVYAVTLNASLTSGEASIESCVKTAQLFGNVKPCLEKTLSVKAEDGPKRYLVSLIKVDDEFKAVIDDITSERVKPLWQIIAGKSKLSLAVYDELQSILHEFQALNAALSAEADQTAVVNSMQRTLLRAAAKLSDSIAKQNVRNGTAYTVEDFVSAVI